MDYKTPILVSGHFLSPPRGHYPEVAPETAEDEELELGEAGECFHACHYGGAPNMVISESYGLFEAIRMIDLEFV